MSHSPTPSRRILETSFGALSCWDTDPAASGPPLLFLQGLLARPTVWSQVTAALAGRRCITVDWPFGAHEQPMRADAELSPPAIARLVSEVLDLLGLERAVLVGNDSGGVVAQLVAATEPDRVDSLVLVACDAFEVFPPRAYRPLFRLARVPGVLRLVGAALSVPGIARSRLGFGAVARNTSLLAERRPLAGPMIRRDLRKLMSGSSSAQTLQAARTFGDYDRPVLVVWAEDDRLFPRPLGQRLADAFPRGRMVLVPGARTFVPVDEPTLLARLIGEFLQHEVPT